jgi:hypothetical protein
MPGILIQQQVESDQTNLSFTQPKSLPVGVFRQRRTSALRPNLRIVNPNNVTVCRYDERGEKFDSHEKIGYHGSLC